MTTFYAIEQAKADVLYRESLKAYNKAHDNKNEYIQGYTQGINDFIEFALQRGTPKELLDALTDMQK